jgi:hypothetical protein
MSDGTEMALPGNGSALRAAQASSHAAALRDVMKTLEQPAWMRLVWVSCRSHIAYSLRERTQKQREGPVLANRQ